jgi:hypothetical protein
MKEQMVRSSSKQGRDRIIFLLFFLPVLFVLKTGENKESKA